MRGYQILNFTNENTDTLPIFSITPEQLKPPLEGLIALLGILVNPVSKKRLEEIIKIHDK